MLEALGDGVISTDSTHNLYMYKTDSVIIKWYSTTNTLQTQGTNFTALREKLRKLFDTKDEQLTLQAGDMDDSASALINVSTSLDIESPTASLHNKCGGCSAIETKLLNLEQQFEILRNTVPSAPNENMEIRDRNHTLKQQNNELSRRNDELNMSLIVPQKKIRDLENERQSLITAIRLLDEELKTNDSGEIEHPMDSNQAEWQDVPYSKSTKTKITIPKDHAPSKTTREATTSSSETRSRNSGSVNSTSQHNHSQPKRQKKVVIAGDSTLKYLQGHKMSKNSQIKVATCPGCTTQDMKDHIKPLLRRNPDEIIIHVGTNSLHSSSTPLECAAELIDLAESVSSESSAMISISSLITRSDDEALAAKVPNVNKVLKEHCLQ